MRNDGSILWHQRVKGHELSKLNDKLGPFKNTSRKDNPNVNNANIYRHLSLEE